MKLEGAAVSFDARVGGWLRRRALAELGIARRALCSLPNGLWFP